jgi:ElaB/YqjD/DUF883 family membrane-anchored ribosome-binding protein
MATRNQESFDKVVRDAKREASQMADQASRAARRTAGSFEGAVRRLIEEQPYTAVGVALAVGWLLGRTRHPF